MSLVPFTRPWAANGSLQHTSAAGKRLSRRREVNRGLSSWAGGERAGKRPGMPKKVEKPGGASEAALLQSAAAHCALTAPCNCAVLKYEHAPSWKCARGCKSIA